MLRLFKQFYPIRNLFFVLGEGIIILLSVLTAARLLQSTQHLIPVDFWIFLKAILITFTCQACLYYNDLYDLQVTDTFYELGIRLFQALGGAGIFLALIYVIAPNAIIGRGIFGVSILFVIVLIVSWRFLYAYILRTGIFNLKILLLGSSKLSEDIIEEINLKRDCGYSLAIRVLEHPREGQIIEKTDSSVLYREDFSDLCYLSKQFDIKKIVVALNEKRGLFPLEELLKCRIEGIEILEGANFYEMLTGKIIVEQIKPAWLIFSDGFEKSIPTRFFKRSIDIFLALIALIILSPVIVLVALAIKIDSRGPIFFAQERVGRNHDLYRMFKFRSMVADAEKTSGPAWAEKNDPRITWVGKQIRLWRIDELPQLWNVIKGEMSLIGPRPEREYFTKQLLQKIPYYNERFSVKPGITGWAQVCYGYGASLQDAIEKLNYDLFYIKNMSIWMDIVIIVRTIKIVLFSKGAR